MTRNSSQRRQRLRCVAASGMLLFAGCTRSVEPAIFADLETLNQSRQLAEAKPFAPQAVNQASLLQAEAERALQDGDELGAELLAERAIAAIQRAVLLARLARAERSRAETELELETKRRELAELEQQHHRVDREIEGLETRARVLRDTLPLTPNVATAPKQAEARKEAAIALGAQARLLCLAVALVQGEAGTELGELQRRLDALDQRLGLTPASDSQQSATEPIDEAIALRARCLSLLTTKRRAATLLRPEVDAADALLQELSRAGFQPSRDDRGVVVMFPHRFSASSDPELRQSLQELAKIAKTYPDFAILVVAHSANPATPATRQALAEVLDRAQSQLREHGVDKVAGASVDNRIPIALPGSSREMRNERLEVVFVAPTN